MIRLGVDLGGTKMYSMGIDDNGRELLRRRVSTPRHEYEATLDVVFKLVSDAESELGERGSIGLGTPGSISPATGLLRNSNSTWLNGKPLLEDLTARLQREVRIENDANCFALSEATDGAAAGQPVVFGVILGTGVGGAIVVDGKLLSGPSRIAGEWGHNPLPWPRAGERPGPQCYCGLTGCIETFLCGPGLTEDHLASTGEQLHSVEIVQRAVVGDPACEATLARYEDRLARGLAHVINIVDPHVVVLGGGMSNVHRLYERVPKLWQEWVFADRVDTRLLPNRHGDSSGVRGAAWLNR